jgi:hypothetical protein
LWMTKDGADVRRGPVPGLKDVVFAEPAGAIFPSRKARAPGGAMNTAQ